MHHRVLHRADGGIVDKALEAVGGQQPDPVAMAKNVVSEKRSEPLFFAGSPEHTQNLQNWFKNSHEDLADKNGMPKTLYIGTTGDFNKFDRRKMNIEGDHGAGFYASNSIRDVNANYAGEGPDLKNKIDRYIDQNFSDDIENPDTGEDYTQEEMREMAKDALGVKHMGAVMPVHITMKNPVVLGGKNESFFDFEHPYNEKTDEYGEPKGKLVNVLNGIRQAGAEFDLSDHDVDDMISKIHEHAMDRGGIHANDLESIIKKGAANAYDPDTGDSATNEIWRLSLENAGHDGIIDHTVNDKFGSNRRGFAGALIRGMEGVTSDTTHYITFRPEQKKSAVGNRGTFDPNETDIRKAEGGIVDKALGVVDGQQPDPVAMAKDVATAPAARQLSPLGLYSQGAEVAANLPQAKGSPQQMKAMLKGVKQEELGGYDDAFAGKKSVTKDEIAEHFRNQMPQVEERVLHGDDGDTKFGTEDLTLPGGENYREVLLKSPVASAPVVDKKGGSHGFTDPTGRRRDYWSQQEAEQAAKSFYRDSGDFKSAHWDDPNVLAHLRMSDRTGPNGEKILHIEEIQSDWAQEGRELRDDEVKRVMKEKGLKKSEATKLVDPNFGFAQPSTKTMSGQAEPDGFGNYKVMWEDGSFSGGLSKEAAENRAAQGKTNAKVGVPTGPYVTSTPAWTDLALKRALKEAAEGGYDKIVWTPGAEHAKRYSLDKKVDRIAYDPEQKEFSYVQKGVNGWQTHPENVDPEDLPKIIGKDAAEQLLAQEVAPLSGNHVMEASDLIIGDKGMKGYYDNIVPKRLQELVKKHDPDARVGAHEIPNSGETRRQGHADVGEIMNWHPAYTNLSRQEQSARWNEMTPVNRRQLIKDYESDQSGDIMGHGIEITPKMRESILKGQTAFKRGGSVSPEQAELQRRMQSILRPDSDDPEMVQKYLQARASYDMPTHERGAYSARVLPMAAHNVQTTIGPLGNAVPKQAQDLTWNGFHKIGKGGTLFTLGGDRSNLGRLTHINGKEMAWPVDLHAGTKYMTEPNPGAVWANAKGARTSLRTNILEAAKKGPVYGAFAAMGPTAVDSANNMFDVLMAQIPGSGISKTDAKAFDDSLREGKHIKGSSEKDIQKREAVKEIMKNWPGIQNAEKARDFAKTISGGHRGAIVKYMEAAPWQNAGFPSVGITRAAITDPELLDVSGNMMGHHVVELDPNTYDKRNLAFEHSTYGWPTGGKLVGKLPFIERHVATPDFTEQQVMDKAVVKKTGEPLIIHPYSPNDQGRSSYRGNTEMRQAIQPINDRMLESIQEKHGTSFSDGGKAKSKGDASIVKRALMLTSKKA
jgi:hypothetical protein